MFLYLFTNPKVNMVGIYELPDILMLPSIGCTLEELQRMKSRFEKDEKYYFYDGWVYVNNFSRYNKYSPAANIVDAFIKEFTSIPQDVISHFLNNKQLSYIPPINDKVIVKVIVIVKEGRGYPRLPEVESIDVDAIAAEIPQL